MAALSALLGLLLLPEVAAAAGWSPAVDLATPSEPFGSQPRPELAMDAAGGAVAVWPQYGSFVKVQAASMASDGTWGQPVDLEPGTDAQTAPQVAMNEAGEAVAVWENFGREEEGPVDVAVMSASGEWGPGQNISVPGSGYPDLDVAVGPAGEAIAAWSENRRYGLVSGYGVEAAFMPAGGQWEAPVAISVPDENAWSPQVAFGPYGEIVTAWSQWEGNSVVVRVDEKAAGGSWGQSRKLSEPGYESWSPQVGVGADGAAVIWQSEGWIEASSRVAGGKWEGPVELSGPESTEPRIGADAAGDAIAIWSAGYGEEGEFIESAELPVGGDWSEPTELSGPLLVESTEPRLAVAPNGEAIATWSTWLKDERLVEEAAAVGGEWQEPMTLSGVGDWAVRAAVAMDGAGDREVVWWAGYPVLPQATGIVAPRPGAAAAGTQQPPSMNPPAAPKPKAEARATARRIALVKRGKAYVALRCPAAGACRGSVRLVSAGAHPVAFELAGGGEKIDAVTLGGKILRQFRAAGDQGFHVRLVGEGVVPRTLVLRPPPAR